MISLALAALLTLSAPAQEAAKVVRDVGIDQKLGESIALDLTFVDESGRAVRLGDYFGRRPVVLALVYYRCPMLCSQVLDGIVRVLRGVSLVPGSDFEIVVVSIDPKERSDLAAAKKASCVAEYGRASGADGWHFLVGPEESIRRLADDAGFRYVHDPQSGQYAHASGFFVLTPKGVLSRCFYGLEHSASDLRLALVESSEERIGSLVDQVLLLCFHYDPTTGKYGFVILNAIRAIGLITVAGITVFLWIMLRRDRGTPRLEAGELKPAMWQDFPLFPESASSLSGRVDALLFFLLGLSAFFATLICTVIVVFSFKYRRRPDNLIATPIEGSLPLEITWMVIPFGLTMVIFVWGAKIYFAEANPPGDVTDVYVVAKQWMWKIQHPQGQREINDLHVPVGQAIRLTMTSEDVIHSFFVPAFRVKQDVLPNRYTHMWFRATKTGVYHLFCAEYCGTKHSGMIGRVFVMEPQEYERWLSGSTADEPLEETGRKLFESMRCDTCHKEAPDARGPVLRGLFGRQVALEGGASVVADEAYVRESILKPLAKVTKGFQPLMPTYEGQLGEEQILQIIAYLKTLKAAPAGVGGPR